MVTQLDDQSSREGRPSPDALLQAAQQEARGRLKIFVGAAPGVGKTYEMLTAARARLQEGIDVVAGVVETHGRKETEALLTGLEAITTPTRRVQRTRSGRDGSRRTAGAPPTTRAGR